MPRPLEYLHKTPENGFGFPSGHVLTTFGFWGYLGSRLKNPSAIIIAAASILAVIGVGYLLEEDQIRFRKNEIKN
jgi:membrane-associated phospholipid phosphatase